MKTISSIVALLLVVNTSVTTHDNDVIRQIHTPTVKTVEVAIEEPDEYNWLSPCSTSSSKTYMDYRKITNKTSKQYKYIKKHMKPKDGLLYDKDENIGVALGSWWGDIGSKWTIELDTGVILNVVKVDEKADKHVNNGCEHKKDKSVIEFVIDVRSTPKSWNGNNGYVLNGNFNNHKNFNGSIKRVARQ